MKTTDFLNFSLETFPENLETGVIYGFHGITKTVGGLMIILTITMNIPLKSAAFVKERIFSRISDIICDNVNNT